MKCPKCGNTNPESAKFCGKCGAKLARTCPRCGAELPPDLEVRFCFQCGAEWLLAPEAEAVRRDAMTERLQRLVPKEYAERLLATRGQPHDERRTVTILFCDVKGSTAMEEKLDPEEVKEIMDGAFEFLIPPVYRFEGTLAQLMGDAILAFFGAPIAHEDDPERAMRAGLEIIEGAKRYAEKLEQEREIAGFNVRVGVNTGLVVVGELGSDLRVAYTAVGDAINLAARMESAAEPGTILITEATHKLIAPLFESESLGRIEVKGKAEPVSVYRVLAARAAVGKVRGIAGLESPLVGREAELAALQEAIERLQAGVGGIVTVVGDAGIGKSRLVAEVRNPLHVIASPCPGEAIPPPRQGGDCFGEKMPRNDLQVRWVEGRCLSYGTTVPYLLWLDVLRGLLGVSVQDSPEAVRDVLYGHVQDLCHDECDDVYPYLARLMSLPLEKDLTAKLDDLDGQELKARTWQAVEKLMACAAAERPLVLVCEDLHWADSASLELLGQLLALTDRTALLFILVFRPEPEHGSWRLREVAASCYPHRHMDLRLQPLSGSESGVLVGNLLRTACAPPRGVEQLQPEVKRRILDVAEGNPFYVEEIIRTLIDQGAIVYEDAAGGWQATASAVQVPIPDTLQGLLIARIDRLQEDTKRVLQMASVIGRFFLYRVLATIAEEERRLDEHLLTLQRQEMIRERARIPELQYIFKHELTREAAYHGLLKRERRTFHRQVAEALERLYPDRIEEQVGLLAYHWERAGDAAKATHYLLRAGDQARLAYAHEEALDHYSRALQMAHKLPPDEATQVEFAAHRCSGQLHFSQGRFGEAIEDYQLLVGKAQRVKDVTTESEAHAGLAQCFLETMDHERAMTHADCALALAASLGDERLTAKATWIKTMVTFMAARFSEGAALIGQCIDLSKKLGDKVSEAEALWYLGAALVFQGDYELGRTVVGDGLQMCREVKHGLYLNGCYYLMALDLANVGKYGQALAALDDLIRTAEETSIPYWLPRQFNVRGYIHHELGAVAQAIELDQRSLQAARDAGGQPEVESHALVNLATDHRLLGDFGQSGEYLRACEDRLKRKDGCTTLCRTRWLWNWGELSMAEGDYEGALKYAQETLNAARSIGEKKYLARGGKLKGEALALAGKLDEAADELHQALQIAQAIGQRNLTWQIGYSLGQLHERQERHVEAKALYEQALSNIEQIAGAIGDPQLTHTFTQSRAVRAVHEALARLG